jgi:Tfp pilus assembly protein PilP
MTRAAVIGWGVVLATALGAGAALAGPDVSAEPGGDAVGELARAVEPANDLPYDAAGRRDPFRPPRVGSAPSTEPRTPLQRYEIGQLRLVAVIYDTGEPRAVVEDDQKLGYIVKVGTPIGPNGGVVRSIERGRVRITEQAVDYYGERRESEVTMELRTAERGKE